MQKYVRLLPGRLWVFITSRWLLLLFGFSLAIRLVSLSRESFWYDETFTALVSSLPISRMFTALAGDVHPPLFYLITWLLSHTLGGSEFVLRLPSAIFGSLGVLELHRLIDGLGSKQQARISSLLMAIMPAQLYYSQEARMYGLLVFLVLFVANSIVGRKWKRAGIGLALVLYTHNLGAVYAALLGAWALWAGRKRAIPGLALAGLAYTPWIGTLAAQVGAVSGSYWIPPSGNAGGALYYMYFTTFFTRVPDWAQAHAVALAVGLTITSVWLLRRDLIKLWPVALISFGPVALMSLISVAWRPMMLDRALVPSGAALVGLWGSAVPELSVDGRKLIAVLAAPMLVLSVGSYYVNNLRSPIAEWSAIITDNWQTGDVIYHTSLSSTVTIDYYLPGYDSFMLPDVSDLSQGLTEDTKQAMALKDREIPVSELIERGYKRLWLFEIYAPVMTDYELETQRQIAVQYRQIERYQLYTSSLASVELVLLDISNG